MYSNNLSNIHDISKLCMKAIYAIENFVLVDFIIS